MPKKILVLHTGGTISMQADASGAVVTSSDNPMNHVSNPLEGIQVHALDFFNLPSPHIKPKHMLALYQKIKEEAANYDGVVITHGTDTLEETAYFLDTMEVPHMPIVLTGAMRSSNELGSDGVYNYLSALRVASDDRAADKGVLIVMNDEIHAAKYVTKTHTTNVSTFQTPTHGPLGLIMKQEIQRSGNQADDDKYNNIACRLADQRSIADRQTITHTDYRPHQRRNQHCADHYRRAVDIQTDTRHSNGKYQYPHIGSGHPSIGTNDGIDFVRMSLVMCKIEHILQLGHGNVVCYFLFFTIFLF